MGRFIKALTNNLPLKMISVFIAIVIWYLVIYNNDPIITQSYQVHIKVENESYIANGKQLYMIDEENKTVTVYIKANRSQLNRLSADDISVKADLTQICLLYTSPSPRDRNGTSFGFVRRHRSDSDLAFKKCDTYYDRKCGK